MNDLCVKELIRYAMHASFLQSCKVTREDLQRKEEQKKSRLHISPPY
jgi:hypothetical protein